MKESITYADAARCACLDTAPTCDIAVAHGKAALRINAQVDALQAFQQVDIGFHARHRIPLILGLPSRCCFVWPLRKKGPCTLCCVRDAFPSPEPRAPSPEPRAPSPEPRAPSPEPRAPSRSAVSPYNPCQAGCAYTSTFAWSGAECSVTRKSFVRCAFMRYADPV